MTTWKTLTLVTLLCAVWPLGEGRAATDSTSEPGVAKTDEFNQVRPLSIEERIDCFGLVEDAYWSFRIWPEENQTPKPARREVTPRDQILAKVERSLFFEAALAQVWNEPLTPQMIQAELSRIGRNTRHPQLLSAIFAGLNDDPYLVGECYVRPLLAERKAKEHYSSDPVVHLDVRNRAEAELAAAVETDGFDGGTAVVTEQVWNHRSDSDTASIQAERVGSLTSDQWNKLAHRLASRFRSAPVISSSWSSRTDPVAQVSEYVGIGFSPLLEETWAFTSVSVLEVKANEVRVKRAVWPKMPMTTWMEGVRRLLKPPLHPSRSEATYDLPEVPEEVLCQDDHWAAVPASTNSTPEVREIHTSVWTGAEMIVWGGRGEANQTWLSTGGRYDPATDSWTATTTAGAPSPRDFHTAVWTGTVMIIWGGWAGGPSSLANGACYDPVTDSWIGTAGQGAPTGRNLHTAIWSGTEMIVWGGRETSGVYADSGGRYDPLTNAWTSITASHAPSGREQHTAVWTGSKMIVWGGSNDRFQNTGGVYDPGTDSWSNTMAGQAPSRRAMHTAVWTGSKMIVWGGWDGTLLSTGGNYDPESNSWSSTSAINAPSARNVQTVVWTGTEMVVWGGWDNGNLGLGGRYDPAADTWTAVTTIGEPSPRYSHTAVWTGSEMIVWGGNDGWFQNSGGRYRPDTNSWTSTSTTRSPTGRYGHSAIWTGTEMIVWGGKADFFPFPTGGRYELVADAWIPTATYNAPTGRYAHTAVWTGSEMIIWGGETEGAPNVGGLYSPATNTWEAITTVGEPVPRVLHSTVWTGTWMIVWGGSLDLQFNDGGRYNPLTDSWSATETSTAPSGRYGHAAVWTGSEMIVWGGYPDQGTGGRYDPLSDTWLPTSSVNIPQKRVGHTAVWTGSEMIIWGGQDFPDILPSGARYDPLADVWQATSTIGAPTGRDSHSATWTGSQMLVWGGRDIGILGSGGRFDPLDDSWQSMTAVGAPAPRWAHTSIWTGQEVIVWGGGTYGPLVEEFHGDGGRYCASRVTDVTPPMLPSIDGANPAPATWSPDTTVEVTWSGATDDWTGVAGYSILFDHNPTSAPDETQEVIHDFDPHSVTSGVLADGADWYFHLSACDQARNCTGPLDVGPFQIDATPPTSPGAISSPSHGTDPSGDPTIEVSWGAASDATSQIDGYSIAFEQSPAWICSDLKDLEGSSTSTTSAALTDGSWYFHICTVDLAGNWGPVASGGPFVIDLQQTIFSDGFESGDASMWSSS